MVFKLIRADSTEPRKIELDKGTHIFGRGIFLDCEDKRVSRTHGKLEVTDDSVKLIALHQNPCFVTKKSTTDTIILKSGSSEVLCNGDKFGLLPDTFWYELILCNLAQVESNNRIIESTTDISAYGSVSPVYDDQNGHQVDNEDDEIIDLPLLADDQIGTRSESPSLLGSQHTEVLEAQRDSDTQELSTESNKRPHSPCDMIKETPTKVARTQEPKHELVSPPTVKAEPPDREDIKPGTSSINDQVGSSNGDVKPVKAEPLAQAAPIDNPPQRERCIYGAGCYRRNPQHKVQFSHPGEADWGAGERGACPWGAGCRRRDPRHWRHHEHPPGTLPPAPGAPQRPGNVRKREHRKRPVDSPSTDSDTPGTDVDTTLPAKRVRKTVKRLSWSGSEPDNEYDLDDPFLTDGSDDWCPSEEEGGNKAISQAYSYDSDV